MLTNKGQELTFDVVPFAFAVGVFVFSFLVIQSITGSHTSSIVKQDHRASISLIAESVVNSPECLLYTETEIIGDDSVQKTFRNIIDWEKVDNIVDDMENYCIEKGPYKWKATILNKDTSEEIEKGSFCGSVPERLSKNILIKSEDEFHAGEITIKAGSREFRAEFDNPEGSVELFVQNIGTCDTEYLFKEVQVDSDGNILASREGTILEYGCEGSCEILEPGEVGTTGALEYTDSEDYYSRVTVRPADLDNYRKSYEYQGGYNENN